MVQKQVGGRKSWPYHRPEIVSDRLSHKQKQIATFPIPCSRKRKTTINRRVRFFSFVFVGATPAVALENVIAHEI